MIRNTPRSSLFPKRVLFFFLMIRQPPRSPLFPYPTLSRSGELSEPGLAPTWPAQLAPAIPRLIVPAGGGRSGVATARAERQARRQEARGDRERARGPGAQIGRAHV